MVEIIFRQFLELCMLLPYESFKQIPWTLMKKAINWTSEGTIDKKSAAETLADEITLSVEIRLQIAVKFQLEDRINALALQIPTYNLEAYKKWLELISAIDGASTARQLFNLHHFTECYIDMFELMLKTKNDVGCAYYWPRLTEQEKLELLKSDLIEEVNHCMLFLFLQFNEEWRQKVLHNEKHLCALLTGLLNLEWIAIFEAVIQDFLKLITPDSILEVLHQCAKWAHATSSTIACKNKYKQVGAMLIQFLFEISAIKPASFNFFSIIASSSYLGMMEFVVNTALPTVRQKKAFLHSGDANPTVVVLIHYFKEIVVIDQFLSLLVSNPGEIKRYKTKFAKKRGCEICIESFEEGEWRPAINFVQWCFSSKKKMNDFYRELLTDDSFVNSFTCENKFTKFTEAAASFIKESKLGSLPRVNELIAEVCEGIIASCYFYISNYLGFDLERGWIELDTSDLFKAVDKILLAFTNDDQEKLMHLRKEIFTDKTKKIFTSLPIKVLDDLIKYFIEDEDDDDYNMICDTIDRDWHDMVEELFDWSCSSDKKLKAKVQKELWESKEIIEAKKKFAKKT